MNESHWQQRITDLCDLLDLKWHHETDSRRSKSGFPDLVIAGPGGVMFVELKTDKGRVSKDQEEWIARLRAGGAEAHIWRPCHWEWAYYRLHSLAERHALPLLTRG